MGGKLKNHPVAMPGLAPGDPVAQVRLVVEVEEGLAVGVGLGPGAGPEHGALGVGEQGPSPRSLICACNLKIWTPMCLQN